MLGVAAGVVLPYFFPRVFLAPTQYQDPLVRGGIADLRGIDLSAGSGTALDKGWDLTWARFSASEPAGSPNPTVRNASSLQHWTAYADWEGQPFPALGWATYALHIRLGSELNSKELALKFNSSGAAIRVWWDGRPIETRGRLARNPEQFVGDWSSDLIILPRIGVAQPAPGEASTVLPGSAGSATGAAAGTQAGSAAGSTTDGTGGGDATATNPEAASPGTDAAAGAGSTSTATNGESGSAYTDHLLVFEVSQFMNEFGGMPDDIRIMTREAAEEARFFELMGNFFVTGFFFVMALYHLIAFGFRTKNRSMLLFGFICLCLTVRMLFQEAYPILVLLPDLDPLMLMKVNHATFAALLPGFLLMYIDLYPFKGMNALASVAIAAIGGWALVLILGDGASVSAALRIFQIFALLLAAILLARLVVAISRREPGSVLLGIGLLVVVTTVGLDIADSNRIISIPALVPLGMAVFLVCQALALAKRYARAMNVEEESGAALRDLTKSLARFVPAEFLNVLEKREITEVRLGDFKKQQMAVLVVGIRGFAPIAESLGPEKTFVFLNDWFAKLVPAIRSESGYVDKYFGDSALCIFPGSPAGDAIPAVRAAIKVQQAAASFNERGKTVGYPELNIGVGIQTGEVLLGTIGEPERMDGTVISDAVNVAIKIGDLCSQFGTRILASGEVWKQMNNSGTFRCRYLGSYKFRGKQNLVQLYEVFDADTELVIAQKRKFLRDFEHAVNSFERNRLESAKEEFGKIKAALALPDPAVDYYLNKVARS